MSFKRHILPPLLLIIVLLAGLWWALGWQPQQDTPHQALPLSAAPQGGDFSLQSAAGPVSLKDFRGRWVFLYFGYTLCPDICPTNLSFIAEAFNQLKAEELQRVQGIFVSVDPERDTPDSLKRYVEYFHPDFIGLTASPEIIAEVAARYGAAYQKVVGTSALNYSVDHSAYTYVIDPAGKLRGQLEHATPPQEILRRLRELLQEKN